MVFIDKRIPHKKQAHYILVVCLFLSLFNGFSQDSLSKKTKFKAIIGFKLSGREMLPIVSVHSIVGLEYQLKNKNISFAFRNFFNTQQAAKRRPIDLSQKSLIWLTSKNCFDIFYSIPITKKNNFIKLGAGIYFERNQNASDQFLFLTIPHYQGVELSVYTKLKWINIGFRQQIQLFSNYKRLDIGVKEIYRFNLCFEIPINIK